MVGDDGALNREVVEVLHAQLDYAPLHTPAIVEQAGGGEADPDARAATEAVVFESLCDNVRCCISTSGGGTGAAARAACWQHLHGHVTVWLEVVDGAEEAGGGGAKPQNEAYEASEIHVRLTAAQAADRGEVAEAVLQAAQALLRKDDELVKKKQLYIKVRLD